MRFALVLAAALLSMPALADWTLVGTTGAPTRRIYIDVSTIRPVGTNFKAWSLTDSDEDITPRSGLKFKSSRELEEYDCRGEQKRTLALTNNAGNMGSGAIVFSDMDVSKPSAWNALAPDSIAFSTLQIVCSHDLYVKGNRPWSPLTEHDGAMIYVDRISLRRSAGVVYARTMYDYAGPLAGSIGAKASMSAMFLTEFNCINDTFRAVSYVGYANRKAEGLPTEISVSPGQHEAYVPGGVIDKQARLLCAMKLSS